MSHNDSSHTLVQNIATDPFGLSVSLSISLCLTNYVSVYQNVDMGLTYNG